MRLPHTSSIGRQPSRGCRRRRRCRAVLWTCFQIVVLSILRLHPLLDLEFTTLSIGIRVPNIINAKPLLRIIIGSERIPFRNRLCTWQQLDALEQHGTISKRRLDSQSHTHLQARNRTTRHTDIDSYSTGGGDTSVAFTCSRRAA